MGGKIVTFVFQHDDFSPSNMLCAELATTANIHNMLEEFYLENIVQFTEEDSQALRRDVNENFVSLLLPIESHTNIHDDDDHHRV